MKDENGIQFSPEERAAAAQVLTDLAKLVTGTQDLCPICRKPVTKMEQVRRCVYLSPCGHHYQGRLSGKRGAR